MIDVDFEHPDGRRERVRKVSPVQNKRGAQKYEREVRTALLDGTYGQKVVPNFAEFVSERWLPTYPGSVGNRRSTVREKESHCAVHLVPFFGRYRLDEVAGEFVARFFAHLREEDDDGDVRSEKTVKNIRATLARILASAKEWGEIREMPDLPKVKVPDAPWDFYVREESERLFAASRNEDERALLMFAIKTGGRAGEQIAFESGDIDWHNHVVVFHQSSILGEVGPTKSGRTRKVPMTKMLEAALKKQKHLRGNLVFCNMDGSPYTIDQLHERLWSASKRAGLRQIRWHDLRHSFGSQAAIAGVPLPQIQAWMGHSTITMTMRYAHLAPGTGNQWIERLDAGVAAAQ